MKNEGESNRYIAAAASAYRIACACRENIQGSARAVPSLARGCLFEPELNVARFGFYSLQTPRLRLR
jgi:hypothetical protein